MFRAMSLKGTLLSSSNSFREDLSVNKVFKNKNFGSILGRIAKGAKGAKIAKDVL
jgi:hypothetical protein